MLEGNIDPRINILEATQIFMDKAGQLDTAGRPDMWPSNMPEGLRELRQRMLVGPEGEVTEYISGEDNDDLTEVVDGLLDIIVVAWGTLLAYVGPAKAKAAAAEVVRSNLDKVNRPEGPIFRADGKVLKPAGWTPPDIAGVLAQ